MLKAMPVSIAISVATLFGLFSDPAFPGSADSVYYPTDSKEQRLGMVYAVEGEIYDGELAVDLWADEYVFVRCDSGEVLRGKEYMWRRSYNCEGLPVLWDTVPTLKNIFPHVGAKRLPLPIPDPVLPCGGVCMPSPLEFHIPESGQPGWPGDGYGPRFDPETMPGMPAPGGAPPGGGPSGGGIGP